MPYRPTLVRLMAEASGVFLWDLSPDRLRLGGNYLLSPADLELSPELVAALSSWLDRWSTPAISPELEWLDVADETAWVQDGLDLAYRLQHELGPNVDVSYAHDGDDRPLHDRRGP